MIHFFWEFQNLSIHERDRKRWAEKFSAKQLPTTIRQKKKMWSETNQKRIKNICVLVCMSVEERRKEWKKAKKTKYIFFCSARVYINNFRRLLKKLVSSFRSICVDSNLLFVYIFYPFLCTVAVVAALYVALAMALYFQMSFLRFFFTQTINRRKMKAEKNKRNRFTKIKTLCVL